VKKRVEKENEKFLKMMKKQFSDHVEVLEENKSREQKEFERQPVSQVNGPT